MTSFLVTADAAGVRVMAGVALALGRGEVTGLAAVFGLLIGSFLNVVVYRAPRSLSVVQPRSFCPRCDAPLRSVDNIPLVSWVVLRGRCRKCGEPISARYPLVELATGVTFAAVGWGLGPHWAVPGFCVLAATLIALVAIEGDGLPLPLSVALVGTAVGTVLLAGAAIADRRWSHLIGAVIGVGVAWILTAVVPRRPARVSDGSPWTSAPVVLPVGAALGWLGPQYAAEGLAAGVVVYLVLTGIRRGRSALPTRTTRGVLGLALAAGAVVAVVIAVADGAGAGR
jgi:leader peptidase (prepilin peptidase)/N-methyltransferase